MRGASPSGWRGVLDEPERALHPGIRESRPEAPLGDDPYYYYTEKTASFVQNWHSLQHAIFIIYNSLTETNDLLEKQKHS